MTQTFGFAEARLRCSKYLPYTYSHVAALIPVPKPGLGVPACVDKHMRVYFDPAIFDEWSIDECTAVILHEDMHLLLGHHKRAAEYLGENATSEDLELWNTACDMTVNYTLQQAGVPCRDDWVFAEKFGFPPNLSVEDYWERLKAQQEPEEEEEEPGDSPTDSDKPGDGDSEDGGEDGQDGDSDDSAPRSTPSSGSGRL